MLTSNQFVHIFSLDFTKAFDTVRHSTLMSKMSQLPISDIYIWIKDFFEVVTTVHGTARPLLK